MGPVVPDSFNRSSVPVCIGETLWVPLCTHEHPTGAHTVPNGYGYVTFLFVSHAQPTASRLPYHPFGGGITPEGCDKETFNARTRVHVRVACNFGPFY